MVRAVLGAVLMGVVFFAGCDNSTSKSKGPSAAPKSGDPKAQAPASGQKSAAAAEKDPAATTAEKPAATKVDDPFAPVEKASKPAGAPVSLEGPVLPGLEPAAAPSMAAPAIKPVGKGDK